jgi:hypothetical protein
VDVDARIVPTLLAHLRKYRVREQVAVDDATAELTVVQILPPPPPLRAAPDAQDGVAFRTQVPSIPLLGGRDPRHPSLGLRLLVPSAAITPPAMPPAPSAGPALVSRRSQAVKEALEADPALYTLRRYELGVPEGVVELPPLQAFPFESIMDHTHGGTQTQAPGPSVCLYVCMYVCLSLCVCFGVRDAPG